jgi:hypothetical protein
MRKIHIIYIVILALVVLVAGFLLYKKSAYAPANIATLPVASYSGGATVDHIQVVSLKSGDHISSPLEISGLARGSWYFEASFPITVVNWDGLIIGEGYATAQSDWMTEDLVPFTATITFERPENIIAGTYSEKGAVIFKNDNPSGDPSRDMAVEVPVKFK